MFTKTSNSNSFSFYFREKYITVRENDITHYYIHLDNPAGDDFDISSRFAGPQTPLIDFSGDDVPFVLPNHVDPSMRSYKLLNGGLLNRTKCKVALKRVKFSTLAGFKVDEER